MEFLILSEGTLKKRLRGAGWKCDESFMVAAVINEPPLDRVTTSRKTLSE
jgi:hypothetical protein